MGLEHNRPPGRATGHRAGVEGAGRTGSAGGLGGGEQKGGRDSSFGQSRDGGRVVFRMVSPKEREVENVSVGERGLHRIWEGTEFR